MVSGSFWELLVASGSVWEPFKTAQSGLQDAQSGLQDAQSGLQDTILVDLGSQNGAMLVSKSHPEAILC